MAGNKGAFTSESARAAAIKGQAQRRERVAAAAAGASAVPGSGLNAGAEERDRALALREARRLLKAATTPDAVKAQLIRTLAGVEDDKRIGKPPSVERLRSLSTEELEGLVLAHY
jgi:hypothetical protein